MIKEYDITTFSKLELGTICMVSSILMRHWINETEMMLGFFWLFSERTYIFPNGIKTAKTF